MTETVVCACCHRTFDRDVPEPEIAAPVRLKAFELEEPEPVCDQCEHQYLAWCGCPPLC